MSFVRPEIATKLRQYREPIITGVITFLCGLLLWRHFQFGFGAFSILVLAIFLVALAMTLNGLRRAALGLRDGVVGEVLVDERKISYFLGGEGWEVSINDLKEITINTSNQSPVMKGQFWHLSDRFGTKIIVPSEAKGFDALFDSISALKGVDYDGIMAATQSTKADQFTVWKG